MIRLDHTWFFFFCLIFSPHGLNLAVGAEEKETTSSPMVTEAQSASSISESNSSPAVSAKTSSTPDMITTTQPPDSILSTTGVSPGSQITTVIELEKPPTTLVPQFTSSTMPVTSQEPPIERTETTRQEVHTQYTTTQSPQTSPMPKTLAVTSTLTSESTLVTSATTTEMVTLTTLPELTTHSNSSTIYTQAPTTTSVMQTSPVVTKHVAKSTVESTTLTQTTTSASFIATSKTTSNSISTESNRSTSSGHPPMHVETTPVMFSSTKRTLEENTEIASTKSPIPTTKVLTQATTRTSVQTTSVDAVTSSKDVEETDDMDLTLIIGCSAGLVLAIVITAISVSFYYRCKRTNSDAEAGHEELGLGDIGITLIRRKRPVKICSFGLRVQSMHRDSNFCFAEEYQDLCKISPASPCKEAERHYNIPKNRYYDILPFDNSRVKLHTFEDSGGMDYINASYIPGYTSQREYIAAQGPLAGTMDDFWKMVWEHNTTVIVMLTKCKEGFQVKCEKYWPEEFDEPKQYGDIVVNRKSLSAMGKYNISVFDIALGEEVRTVKHFQFIKWPDYTAGVQFHTMIEFVKTVRGHVTQEQPGPIIVHCSAGVGRTGTYIAVDTLVQKLKDSNPTSTIDIFNTVLKMRESRPKMVVNEQQYIFIYDCLIEAIAHQFRIEDLEGGQEVYKRDVEIDNRSRLQRTESGTELVFKSLSNAELFSRLDQTIPTNPFEEDIFFDPREPLKPTVAEERQPQGICNPCLEYEGSKKIVTTSFNTIEEGLESEAIVGSPESTGIGDFEDLLSSFPSFS